MAIYNFNREEILCNEKYEKIYSKRDTRPKTYGVVVMSNCEDTLEVGDFKLVLERLE